MDRAQQTEKGARTETEILGTIAETKVSIIRVYQTYCPPDYKRGEQLYTEVYINGQWVGNTGADNDAIRSYIGWYLTKDLPLPKTFF